MCVAFVSFSQFSYFIIFLIFFSLFLFYYLCVCHNHNAPPPTDYWTKIITKITFQPTNQTTKSQKHAHQPSIVCGILVSAKKKFFFVSNNANTPTYLKIGEIFQWWQRACIAIPGYYSDEGFGSQVKLLPQPQECTSIHSEGKCVLTGTKWEGRS